MSELRELGREPIRVIGYSPEGDHAEPSWLVELSLDEACAIGLRFLQDAIYFVEQGELYVVALRPSSNDSSGRSLSRPSRWLVDR